MPSVVTIASPLDAFATITLGPHVTELPQQMRGRLASARPVTLQFEGHGIRSRLGALYAIHARLIAGGEPLETMGGFRVAVTSQGARLVTLSVPEGQVVTGTGVIQVVEASVGPGGPRVQSASVVFYPCDMVRWIGSTTVQRRPGA